MGKAIRIVLVVGYLFMLVAWPTGLIAKNTFSNGFTGLHDAFDYASNQAGCPPYQATNRYEQGGHFRGTMNWRGRTIQIDGPGHRDHSWGRRDWDAIHHYKWLAVAGPDRASNLMIALVEGETIYNGYVFVDGKHRPTR